MMRGYVPTPARAPVLNRNRHCYSVRRYTCWVGRVTPVRAVFWRGRGLPALPALRGGVKAVVSTA